MYRIVNWMPVDGELHGCSFSIVLTKRWKEVFDEKGLSQEELNKVVKAYEHEILDGHGFDYYEHIPQISAMYDDEWGICQIRVPGNACGIGFVPCEPQQEARDGEHQLRSHNMDSIKQASMVLTIFLKVVEWLEIKDYESKS